MKTLKWSWKKLVRGPWSKNMFLNGRSWELHRSLDLAGCMWTCLLFATFTTNKTFNVVKGIPEPICIRNQATKKKRCGWNDADMWLQQGKCELHLSAAACNCFFVIGSLEKTTGQHKGNGEHELKVGVDSEVKTKWEFSLYHLAIRAKTFVFYRLFWCFSVGKKNHW